MAVTIRNIMDLNIVQERAILLAGSDGLDKIISFVTIMEAPDFYEWVSGGEFVLTSWYAFSQKPELQEYAFTEMAKRGIAGIGIKVNRYIDVVPESILKIANFYRIPVFSIRRETKFRELVLAISAEVNNYQTNILFEVDQNYQELVSIALSQNGFEPLLKVFGRKRHCSCICITNAYESVGIFKESSLRMNEEAMIDRFADCLKGHDDITIYRQLSDMHVFPCVARGYTLGYLLIIDSDCLSEKYLLMAQQLATFLTMKFIDRVESEQKMLNSLLDDILFTHTLGEAELRQRLCRLGLTVKGKYRIIVIANDRQACEDVLQKPREHAMKMKNMIENAVLIERHNEIVLLVAEKTAEKNKRQIGWFKAVSKYMDQNNHVIIMSIGPVVTNAAEIGTSYSIAKRLVNIGTAQAVTGILYYMEYLAQSYLYHGMEAPERNYILDNIVLRLHEHDHKYHADLFKTLNKAIFITGIENIAEQMHVHVNTIRHRMRKIEEITGLDFFHSFDRYILTTAVLLCTYTEEYSGTNLAR